MTPEERQLLSGLFDRIRGGASQQRDNEAESFIADAVRQQPYAPYLMAQTVIVQDQALRAANERLQQLEQQVREQQQQQSPQQHEGSFLGGLGRMFGGGQQDSQAQGGRPVPAQGGGFGQPQPYPTQQPQAGPWGGQAPQAGAWGGQPQQQQGGGFMGGGAPGGGGGFLKGALGAAAGVAGGVLLADSIRGLFGGGNNPLGIASGFGGGGFGAPGGETVVNNYYENSDPGQDSVDPAGYDSAGDFGQDDSDDFGGGNSDGDDSYNV